MPKFTITRDGKQTGQVDAHGDRIELGSARTCQVLIDDLLISLKQAAFVRTSAGSRYQVEPVSRVPAFTLNDVVVDRSMDVPDGALLGIEGYKVTIEYLPGEVAGSAPLPKPIAPTLGMPAESPLPPPLEPDLPPPLEPSYPNTLSPAITSPGVPSPAPADSDRTVFIRRVGRLVATAGPLKGQQWDLRSGETRIGREQGQNDIVIRFDAQGNVDNSVSRRHASVHATGDRIYIEDVGSAAGTYVNGNAIPARQRVEVKANDLVEIRSSKESTLLRVELIGSSAHAPAAPPSPQPPAAAEIPRPPVHAPVSAPRHEMPAPGDYGAEEAPVQRRRRRETNAADNPFVPVDAPRRGGTIPKWGWIAAGVGVLLLIAIILLIAL